MPDPGYLVGPVNRGKARFERRNADAARTRHGEKPPAVHDESHEAPLGVAVGTGRLDVNEGNVLFSVQMVEKPVDAGNPEALRQEAEEHQQRAEAGPAGKCHSA